MSGLINQNGYWKNISSMLVNVNGYWKKVQKAFINVNGYWKQFLSAGPTINNRVTISKNTPSSPNYTVTLTGTNNIWSTNTGETYSFSHSSDSGATWGSLATGVAVDSGVYTYTLQNNGTDVVPNVENLYRFTVTAVNSLGSSFSTSTNVSVFGPENITLSETSHTTNSVTINWTSAPNANRYMVEYKQSSSGTWITSGNGAGGYSSSPATITSLYGSTSYDFRVIPWTGSANNKGYAGNYSNTLTVTTATPSAPIQLTSPTISGSGQAFTAITTTAGTYQSGSYISIVSYIGVITSPPSLTDGQTTTPLGSKGSSPYNITQGDATTPPYYFYAVDAVTISGGSVFYYYSSSGIKSFIGSITDTFARTVSTGSTLGVMTPAANSSMTPNSYIYSSYGTSSAWSVNGSVGSNSTNPSIGNTNAAAYPFQTVELTGKTDLNISVNTNTSTPGGTGVMFWATSAGSWYAAAPYQYLGSVTTYTCNQAGSSNNTGCLPDSSGVAGGVCGCTVTGPDYSCNGSTVTGALSCTNGSNSPGSVCNCTFTGNVTTCTGNASGTYYNFSDAIAACGSCITLHPGTASFQTATSINYPSGSSCSVCSYANNGCVKSGSIVYSGGLYIWSACVATPDTYDCLLPVTTPRYSYQTRSSTAQYTYYWNTNDSGTTSTAYITSLRIYSASGSTVSVLSDVIKTSNPVGYSAVAGIKVNTSGNTITAGLYSNSGLTTLIGTQTSYVAISPTKTESNGASSAGLFKAGSANQGSTWDNLSIS